VQISNPDVELFPVQISNPYELLPAQINNPDKLPLCRSATKFFSLKFTYFHFKNFRYLQFLFPVFLESL